jgi:membrane fusion protein (multidrug efflux system)
MEQGTSKRMVAMLAGVGLLLGGIVGFNAFVARRNQRAMAAMGTPPQTVSTTVARYEEWQPSLSAVGTLRAVRGADMAFEVAGVVARVGTRSGADVHRGQELAALDDAAEQAQLRQMEAAAALAEVTFARAKEQMAAKIISGAEFDSAAADAKAKRAAVQQQAALAAKKHLLAPFDGRMGIIATSPGAYLNAGTAVATVQQLDPIFADFTVAQRDLGQVAVGRKVRITLDAFPGRTFTGTVSAVNPKVDSGTRNVQAEATVPNPHRELVPGMFASVSLDVGKRERYLTLPQTAVTYNPYGATVFVVKAGEQGKAGPALAAQQVFVTLGPDRGDQVAVLQGITEGDQVVASGGLKLKNGTPVVVDNSVQPSADPNPRPQEK